MNLDDPGSTDGIDEILVAATLGRFEVVIDYSDRPAELAASLRRMNYTVTLEPRGPGDAEPPSVVRISWAVRH